MRHFYLFILILSLSYCDVFNPIKVNRIENSKLEVDTPKCGLVEVSKSFFETNIVKRLMNNQLNLLNSFTKKEYNYIVYYKTLRSSGLYFFLQAKVDSNGCIIDVDIKQNIYKKNNYTKKIRKKINELKRNKYKVELSDSLFYLNNCYFSDGSDLYIYILKGNELINGLSYIPAINIDVEKDVKYFFSQQVNDILNAFLHNM